MAKNNLGTLLLEAGKTQAELSRETKLSQNTINKAISGKNIAPTTRMKLLNGLNALSGKNYKFSDVYP